MANTLEVIGQVLSIVGGGGVLTFLWTWRSDQLEQYRYLDQAYSSLLDEYRKQPQYGDPDKTQQYKAAFVGATNDIDNRYAYHYFAMSVHNTMETMFDILDGRPLESPQWSRIFMHHARLHQAWLEDNAVTFEPDYVDYVRCLPALEHYHEERRDSNLGFRYELRLVPSQTPRKPPERPVDRT